MAMSISPITPGAEGSLGRGPYPRLVLKNVTVIDGTGAPPYGPADVVIEGESIHSISSAGRNTDLTQLGRTIETTAEVLDLTGHYVLPGLIDAHAHIGFAQQGPGADYIYKLWLGHGITTIREPGAIGNGVPFTLREAARSNTNAITAPRIITYAGFGAGRGEPFRTPKDAQQWISEQAEAGAEGVKFFGAPPAIFEAAITEATDSGWPPPATTRSATSPASTP